MVRIALIVGVLSLVPSLSLAQPPCTTDARRVVEEVYRHVLERAPDNGSTVWVDRLTSGTTVREVVRGIAKSPEHIQRFGTEARESVIRTMYRHILNREPDPQGHKDAVNTAARQGLGPVIDAFVDSTEYQQKFGDWQVPSSSGVSYCGPNARNRNEQSSRNMRFRRMDANGDGRIQRSEWRGNAQSFQNFDWNNDGVLAEDEVDANRAWGDEAANRNDNMTEDDRFDYLDINGNGFVDRNEWDGGYNAFSRLDSNADRRLSRDEWQGTGRASNFASVDLNRDGRVTLSEWPWSHTSFDRQDTNNDGVLSRGEYRGAPSTYRP